MPAADAPPGGVETLALWGSGSSTRRITGAQNVYIPDQTHVQVATSRESFAEMYRFFNEGEAPATIDIVPDASGVAQLSGRAVNFPANSGITDATLEIYEVDPATGTRLASTPDATFALPADGAWGPFDGSVGASYELALARSGSPNTHHIYLQPLIRSDHLVRLNSSLPDQGIGALIERGDNHSALVITRYKEFWGNHPTQNDTLEIDGTNVINAATAPLSKRAIGVFAFDVGSDGVSNVAAPVPSLFSLPFITGVDQYIPAADPPDRTVSVVNVPRGDTTNPQVVNVPNWASSTQAVSIVFNDFVQPSNSVSYTARYSDADCAALTSLASASGSSTADILRLGVDIFGALVAAGAVEPVASPPANDGPCAVVATWSADQIAAIAETADALGVSEDELHHLGGRLVTAIIYVLATQSP